MPTHFGLERQSLSGKRLAVLLASIAVIALAGCRNVPKPTLRAQPVFRRDLRPFGFPTEAGGRIVGSYSDLNFLTDDMVLVTVNTRTYGVDESHPDEPPTKFLLFDIARSSLLKTAEMPVDKATGSVRAAANGGFVVLNRAGLHLCSREMECGPELKGRAPLFVSPGRTRIAIAEIGKTGQTLLDGVALNQLQQFPWFDPAVVPGDNGLIVIEDDKLYVRLPGKPDQALPFNTGDLRSNGVWPQVGFLDASTIAALVSDKTLAVVGIDGKPRYRVPVRTRSHLAEVRTSMSGSRFCLHQAGYSFLGSILAFLDPDRPFNYEAVNVMATDSGKSRFRLTWDPRPYTGNLSSPALSPNGHRVAFIRHGFLEIFEVR